jgi:peroxiredoxin
MNIKVLAINPAPVASHRKWAAKMGFEFPILSDPDGKTAARYKCRKSPDGGVLRTVYALDPDGRVVFAERGHADLNKVKEAIKGLG